MRTNKTKHKKKAIFLTAGLVAVSTTVYAATQILPSTPIELSNTSSLGYAFKTKLARTASGVLVTTYGDAYDDTKVVYDVKGCPP